MDRSFGDLLEDLQDLDLKNISIQVVEDNVEEILDRNRAQLLRGEQTDGRKLPGYAWESYADLKHALNPLPGYGIADHRLTGAYYAAFVAAFEGDDLHIYSLDPKATSLEERVGGKNAQFEGDRQRGADLSYGLGEKEHNEFIEATYEPGFQEEIHRALKLPQ